jgi:hypothetical protein
LKNWFSIFLNLDMFELLVLNSKSIHKSHGGSDNGHAGGESIGTFEGQGSVCEFDVVNGNFRLS